MNMISSSRSGDETEQVTSVEETNVIAVVVAVDKLNDCVEGAEYLSCREEADQSALGTVCYVELLNLSDPTLRLASRNTSGLR